MNWYTYDVEVFAHDFIVGFKDKRTGEYYHFHNDNEGVRDFISDDAIYCGFNSKSYDQYIIKAIVAGLSPEEVFRVNHWIIKLKQNGFECPLLQGVFYKFNNVDIKNDVRKGLGLKSIEAHLGLNIRESDVDFEIDRPLTSSEIREVIEYNKADLDATEKLTAAILSGSRRPEEAGLRGTQSPSATFDYRRATPDQRAAFKRRIRAAAARGEKIYPGK